jgi:hypothetical protein
MTPRLFGIDDAADHLAVSTGCVRGLVAQGVLTPVRIPSCRRPGEASRRLLFAREDLDALVDQWKRSSSPVPNQQLSKAALKGWRSTPERKRGAA